MSEPVIERILFTEEQISKRVREVAAEISVKYAGRELKLIGVFSTAMAKLSHYFTPFQTFIVAEAEDEGGKFDLSVALKVLEHEARYRAAGATPQGTFLYQFECLCRNRLGYDRGLEPQDNPL